MTDIFIWIGIGLCVVQSAMFSGLNLATFSLSRLRLEVEAENGSKAAATLLGLRKDSNFLLTTILWGNVGINVLLTLLSNSVMTGISAFLFSTFLITFGGEIFPQAYFSRNALKMGSLLAPVLRVYQFILYPVAKPSAMILDMWLGHERVEYLKERDLQSILAMHVDSEKSDMDYIEGQGALNFLSIDDISVGREGNRVDKRSIISLPTHVDLPIVPAFENSAKDPFLQKIQASGKKWVVLTDLSDTPLLVIDADGFLRSVFFDSDNVDFYAFCHRPIVVKNDHLPLGDVIRKLKRDTRTPNDEVIERDLILVWSNEEKRVVTGADILGRLLRNLDKV